MDYLVCDVFGLSPVELTVVGVVAIILFGNRLPRAFYSLRRSFDIPRSRPRQLPRQRPDQLAFGHFARYLVALVIGVFLGWLVLSFWPHF